MRWISSCIRAPMRSLWGTSEARKKRMMMSMIAFICIIVLFDATPYVRMKTLSSRNIHVRIEDRGDVVQDDELSYNPPSVKEEPASNAKNGTIDASIPKPTVDTAVLPIMKPSIMKPIEHVVLDDDDLNIYMQKPSSIQRITHFSGPNDTVVIKRIYLGMPVCELRNFCVNETHLVYLVKDDVERKQMIQYQYDCCDHPTIRRGRPLAPYCTSFAVGLCQCTLSFRWRFATIEPPLDSLRPIRSYLHDSSTIDQRQFGHHITKDMQGFVALSSINRASDTQEILLPKVTTASTSAPHINAFHQLVLSVAPKSVLFKGQLHNSPNRLMCSRSMTIIPHHERVFFGRAMADIWREKGMPFVLKKMNATFFPPKSPCPPPVALVYQRKVDANGPRNFLNYDALERALAANNIYTYSNLSFGMWDKMSPILEQVQNAAIVISPHSSQLKNFVYMHPNSIILEVVHRFISTAFREGAQENQIIYGVSEGHISPTPFLGGADLRHKWRNLTIVEDRLAEDIGKLLKKQSEQCGDIVFKPPS